MPCNFSVLVTGLMVAVAVSQAPPDFCQGRDCPTFTVLETNDDYELRSYDPSKWVSIVLTNWREKRQAFRKLMNYFDGENSQGVTMDMAVPVLKKVQNTTDGSDYQKTIFLMIPFDYQTDTPIPTDTTIQIVDMDAMDVYVMELDSQRRHGCRHGHRGHGGRRRGGRHGHGRPSRGMRRRGRFDRGDGNDEDSSSPQTAPFSRRARHSDRRANHQAHQNRYRAYSQQLVDQLKSAIGDPTLYDDSFFYTASYGHRRGGYKELWLPKA